MTDCRLKKPYTAQRIAEKYFISLPEAKKLLAKGTIIELEHTSNYATAQTIASHHIFNESKDYYEALKKMESKFNEVILYHITDAENEKIIKKQGIVPQKKASYQNVFGADIRKHKKSIYAFTNQADTVKWAFKREYDGKKPVIIIVFKANINDWKENEHLEAQLANGKWLQKEGIVEPNEIIKIIPFVTDIVKKINSVDFKEQANLTWEELDVKFGKGGGINKNLIETLLTAHNFSDAAKQIHIGEDELGYAEIEEIYNRTDLDARQTVEKLYDKKIDYLIKAIGLAISEKVPVFFDTEEFALYFELSESQVSFHFFDDFYINKKMPENIKVKDYKWSGLHNTGDILRDYYKNNLQTGGLITTTAPTLISEFGGTTKIETGQAIINKINSQTTHTHEFDGKLLTHKEIVSLINQETGGKPMVGGSAFTITSDGRHGGEYAGNSHAHGGIKALVVDIGRTVEIEGKELGVKKESVHCDCIHTFNNKQMTNKEILSAINTENGHGVPILANGGDVLKAGGAVNNELLEKVTTLVNEANIADKRKADVINKLMVVLEKKKDDAKIEEIIAWFSNTINPSSRKILGDLLGQKLPITQKATDVFLRQYLEVEPKQKLWLTKTEAIKIIKENIGKKVFLSKQKRDWQQGRKGYVVNPELCKIISYTQNEVEYKYDGNKNLYYIHIDNIRDVVIDGKSSIGDKKNEERTKDLFPNKAEYPDLQTKTPDTRNIEKSVLNQDTDLLGEGKDFWMLSKTEFIHERNLSANTMSGVFLKGMDIKDFNNWIGEENVKDGKIKVYRGTNIKGAMLNNGDFVTINAEYAKKYGKYVFEKEIQVENLKYYTGTKNGNPELISQTLGGAQPTEMIYVSSEGNFHKKYFESDYPKIINQSIKNGNYKTATARGRMTANDAKIIIESAELQVPQEILDLQTKTPETMTPNNDKYASLNKRFNHHSWFKDGKTTIKEALDYFAQSGDFYLGKKPAIKQSDKLLDDMIYDDILKFSGKEGGTYRLNDLEKEYFLERKEYWNKKQPLGTIKNALNDIPYILTRYGLWSVLHSKNDYIEKFGYKRSDVLKAFADSLLNGDEVDILINPVDDYDKLVNFKKAKEKFLKLSDTTTPQPDFLTKKIKAFEIMLKLSAPADKPFLEKKIRAFNLLAKMQDETLEQNLSEGGNINTITEADITEGAKFKLETGTIFIIDKVYSDKEYGTLVKSSTEGGAKDNYRDSIEDTVAFFNEEKAVKIFDDGGGVDENLSMWKFPTHKFNFEIYTKNPKTGESGWDIKFVSVFASSKPEAIRKLKELVNYFDEIILYDYTIPMNDNDYEFFYEGYHYIHEKRGEQGRVPNEDDYSEGGEITDGNIVFNHGNGIVINNLFKEWNSIKTQQQHDVWVEKVQNTKFGTYGTISIFEVLENFEPKFLNEILKKDFYSEIEYAIKRKPLPLIRPDADVCFDSTDRMAEGGTLAPYTLSKSRHTKTGADIWIVKMNSRLDSSTYKAIESKIKQNGGYWSRFVNGFVFNIEPNTDILDNIFGMASIVSEKNSNIPQAQRGLIPFNEASPRETVNRGVLKREWEAGKMLAGAYKGFDGMTDSSYFINDADIKYFAKGEDKYTDSSLASDFHSSYDTAHINYANKTIEMGYHRMKYKPEIQITDIKKPTGLFSYNYYIDIDKKTVAGESNFSMPDHQKEYDIPNGTRVRVLLYGKKYCGIIIDKKISTYTITSYMIFSQNEKKNEEHKDVRYIIQLDNGNIQETYNFEIGECNEIEQPLLKVANKIMYPEAVWSKCKDLVYSIANGKRSLAARKLEKYRISDKKYITDRETELYAKMSSFLAWEVSAPQFVEAVTGETLAEQTERRKLWREKLHIQPDQSAVFTSEIAPTIAEAENTIENKPQNDRKSEYTAAMLEKEKTFYNSLNDYQKTLPESVSLKNRISETEKTLEKEVAKETPTTENDLQKTTDEAYKQFEANKDNLQNHVVAIVKTAENQYNFFFPLKTEYIVGDLQKDSNFEIVEILDYFYFDADDEKHTEKQTEKYKELTRFSNDNYQYLITYNDDNIVINAYGKNTTMPSPVQTFYIDKIKDADIDAPLKTQIISSLKKIGKLTLLGNPIKNKAEEPAPSRSAFLDNLHVLDLWKPFADGRFYRKFEFSKTETDRMREITDLGVKERLTDIANGGMNAIISVRSESESDNISEIYMQEFPTGQIIQPEPAQQAELTAEAIEKLIKGLEIANKYNPSEILQKRITALKIVLKYKI